MPPLLRHSGFAKAKEAAEGVSSQVNILARNFMIINNIIYNRLQYMTKKIVTFLEKYLHDYKNSHIFVVKD
jgi:hypothetical protein